MPDRMTELEAVDTEPTAGDPAPPSTTGVNNEADCSHEDEDIPHPDGNGTY
jgi:hypothetical protein